MVTFFLIFFFVLAVQPALNMLNENYEAKWKRPRSIPISSSPFRNYDLVMDPRFITYGEVDTVNMLYENYEIVFFDASIDGAGELRRGDIVFVDRTDSTCFGKWRNRRCLSSKSLVW